MISHFYHRIILTVAFVSMFGLVVLTCMQVIARYFFSASMFWPEELARAILIVMTFLLAGESYRRGELISAKFFCEAFGSTAAKVFELLSLMFSIALMAVLIYLGFEYSMMNSTQVLAALQVPVGWIYFSVPLGCLLLLGQLSIVFVARLRSFSGR